MTASSETCCPEDETCTRTQPPRLFQIDGDGCWAVALEYTEDGDGQILATELHLLPSSECETLTAAFSSDATPEASPEPETTSGAAFH